MPYYSTDPLERKPLGKIPYPKISNQPAVSINGFTRPLQPQNLVGTLTTFSECNNAQPRKPTQTGLLKPFLLTNIAARIKTKTKVNTGNRYT